MKICIRCNGIKPETDFGPHSGRKDGLQDECRQCHNSRSRESYYKNKGKFSTVTIAAKLCPKCGQIKSASQFYRNSTNKTGLSSHCNACTNQRSKEWREKNPEQCRSNKNEWRKDNPEKNKAARKRHNVRYTATHQEELRARSRANYRKPGNKEHYARLNKEWKEAHPGYDAEWYAKQKEKNPGKMALLSAVKNAKRRKELRIIRSPEMSKAITNLLAEQGFKCANPRCRADLRKEKRHLDHKKPVFLGGKTVIENLQWLCSKCNLSKGAMPYDKWCSEVGISSGEVMICRS